VDGDVDPPRRQPLHANAAHRRLASAPLRAGRRGLLGKPISQARVLDLACLEGHYAIEFALHGAEVTAIEIREANIAKARYAKEQMGLGRLRLVQDDVRNVSVEK
jgi:2-polyprenyl-3-methyl-5-hydroxy-6-metoxy-1,4-benzoquinol methylase